MVKDGSGQPVGLNRSQRLFKSIGNADAGAAFFKLGRDIDSTQLCERLNKRGIPFVTYSGYTRADVAGRTGVLIEKPAPVSILVATVLSLLSVGISAGLSAAGPLANGHADSGK